LLALPALLLLLVLHTKKNRKQAIKTVNKHKKAETANERNEDVQPKLTLETRDEATGKELGLSNLPVEELKFSWCC
jgi:hypothetical protein